MNRFWESMSVDEYAALQLAMGVRLVKHGQVWWRKVRPFFYRPMLLYRDLDPGTCEYPFLSRLGGFQHAVSDGVRANSRLNLLMFEAPRTYSLESLKGGHRRHVRRAAKAFSVRPIVDVEEFITRGHAVYLSFYERTKYGYKNDRTDPVRFAAWAQLLFRFPKARVLGAFREHEQDLASVSVSYVVEDVLFTPTFFSRSEALRQNVSDLMLHTLLEQASASDNVTLIFNAVGGMERGLDEFYLRRGAWLVSKPALLRMNPFVQISIKNFKGAEYLKLGIPT